MPPPSETPAATVTTPPLLSEPCGLLLPASPAELPAVTPQAAAPAGISLEDIPPEDLPEEARAAVEQWLAQPEDVAIVAYRVNNPAAGLYVNADRPMPLASVVKVINLVAYAQAANDGLLNPAEWVPLSELERFYLPNSDLSAHPYAVQELDDLGFLADDEPSAPLEEIPWMMVRHSSNAAADYLHRRLGQRAIEQTALDLGLTTHSAPCPWLGQFLLAAQPESGQAAVANLEAYAADGARYGEDVIGLVDAYLNDPAFKQAILERRRFASLSAQRTFAESLNAQGTARQYAALMARISQNELSSGYVNILVRRNMEWPMMFEVNQPLFWTMGYKGGSLPGVLTGVYYAEPLEYRVPVVVAMFYRNMPTDVYREWRDSWPHDELARWILADPEAAIPVLRGLVGE
jgi:beta-lactamase class A